MGLDQYLYAEKYVGGWEHGSAEERQLYQTITGALGQCSDEGSPSLTVKLTAGYWRKANAIHRWFVQNVQGGEDECNEFSVTLEHLERLHEAVNRVLESTVAAPGMVHKHTVIVAPEGEPTGPVYQPGEVLEDSRVAREVLPTQEGFFFGHTDYDEGYLYHMRLTQQILVKAIALHGEGYHLSYRSSW